MVPRKVAGDQEADRILIPSGCIYWLNKQRPGSEYRKELSEDFAQIEPHLPEKVDSIIDVGCGMAGIDVYLKRKYPQAKLTLLDGDGNLTNGYGYKAVSEPYNSRAATEEFLKANGVSVDRWLDIGTEEVLKADLIISLLSWGFHYPLSAYKADGYCIVDIRRNSSEVIGTVIHKAEKYDRCAVRM